MTPEYLRSICACHKLAFVTRKHNSLSAGADKIPHFVPDYVTIMIFC